MGDFNNIFDQKTILVSGGLGSIGTEIVKKLQSYNIKKIIILDNRETELFYAKIDNSDPRIHFEFADIRFNIQDLFKDVDIVFHAAAMKHVIISEEAPWQTVETNVIGTKNVIDACIANKIKKMILISTDKAVNPTNVMGATKLLAEKLIGAIINSKKNGLTDFGIIRFGNVLQSRGSVLEIWQKQIDNNENITLTDGDMTRFFMSTSQCVNLIFKGTQLSKYGEIFILKMPSVKIHDLAETFLEVIGSDKSIKTIGIRKGEKKHEELILETTNGIILENDNLFVKFPDFVDSDAIEHIKKKGFIESKVTKFSSTDQKFLLKKDKLKETLEKELGVKLSK